MKLSANPKGIVKKLNNRKTKNHKTTGNLLSVKSRNRILIIFAAMFVAASMVFATTMAQRGEESVLPVKSTSKSQDVYRASAREQKEDAPEQVEDNNGTFQVDEILASGEVLTPQQNPEGVTVATVTATAGTTGPTNYSTLKAAFDAINAGTHQGAITVSIVASSNEGTTPVTLNSGDATPASYTSVSIRPTVDGVTISGNPVTGFGVIQLNGADNVTIDGDNPNSAGTNRNLTVSNTAATTVIANSAIRIATSAAVTSANNNTIRNCVLLGNVTSGNASAITSTTGSSNSSFGIYVGGNGGATAVGAPTAITSVTAQTAPSGTTINNLVIDNNVVNQAARAIVFNGAATSVSTGVTISNNVIGDQTAPTPATPPYTAPATTVYTKGIWVAGTGSIIVSGNTLNNIMSYVGTTVTAIELVSPIGATAAITNNTATNIANNGTASIVKAILISNAGGAYSISGNTVTNVQALANTSGTDGIEVTAAATGGTIERNKVTTVYNRNAGTFGAYGINLTAGTGINILNNFVSDINMNMTGGAAFSTQFSVHGIRIAGGTNHKVYHNSVNLFGALLGTATTSILTSAFTPTVNTITGMDVRNNIFSNTMTGGTTSIAHVSIFLPSSSTSTMNLTLNNNDYFSGTTAGSSGIAHVGTTFTAVPAGSPTFAGLYTAANFDPTMTSPTTNLRAYTSTLSAAGTNDNASKVVDPLFVSPTDLHIAVASPMVDMGASVGILNDIDGQLRVGTPDIGADEPSGLTPPANDIAATAIVSPAPGSLFPTGTTYSPQASFINVGTATQTNVNVQFTVTGPGGYNYSNTQTIATIAPNQSVTVTFASAPAFTTPGTYNMTASVTTPDANNTNDTVTGTLNVANPLGGSINVGTGETFTSLTNPGGIFEALNGVGATSNITINITTDLTAETGAVSLNQLSGGFSVTIQPSGGAARIISGSNATVLINLNGADNVTINGLNTGGNSLLIRNTNTTSGSVIRLINDASNNTIQNCTIEAGNGSTSIIISTGTTTGNDNISIANNIIRDRSDVVGAPFNGFGSVGTSAAIANSNISLTNNQITNFNQAGVLVSTGTENVTITGNDISSTANRTTTQFGVVIPVVLGTNTISQNTIHGLRTSVAAGTGASTAGILLQDARGMTVSRNRLYDFAAVTGGTGRIVGIEFDGGSGTPASATMVNNMISIVTTTATNQSIFGIFDFSFGGNTFTADHNSIYIGGASSGTNASWGIVRGTAAPDAYTARNNLVFNNRTGGGANHFAGGDQSANTGTFVSNGNFFAGTGATTAANFMDYGTAGAGTPVSFAAWQTGPPTRDANSVAGVASTFNPADFFVNQDGGDLHLKATATPVLNAGQPLPGVTNDYDNDARSATTPDIGADELTPGTVQLSAATYSVGEASPTVTITVNRTSGTDGAVSVNYSLSDGTATGGAACGGSVDYINTGGTVNFAAGQSSQTFTVAICNDAVFEGNETFNVTLSGATGGATIGAQASAVVTITDDEVAVPGTLQFSSATYTVGEAGPTVTITVTRTGGSDGIVTADYATVAGGTATGGAACGGAVDYVNTSGTVTFGNGVTTPQTFNIPICDDATVESAETVNLALSNATGGATLGTPNSAVLTITDNDTPAGNVIVNPGNVSYMTLGDAVAAINAGTHTGAVTVDIFANTTETGSVVLNSSGVGAANYTSVAIRPAVDGVTVAGPSVQGRGLIELNGADNVTIDGDNPNTAGTNRNLTIQNNAVDTTTFTSVIRIALATTGTGITSADNVTIRNVNILGSAIGKNVLASNTTTGPEFNTFGILAGAGATATTPAAVTSATTTIGTGATASNLTIDNNTFGTAARAVSINGSATTVFPGLLVNGNIIGNSTANDVSQIYTMGVAVGGTANGIIRGNTIYLEGFVPTSAANQGVSVGVLSVNTTGVTVEKNRVNRVKNNNPNTWSAMGINLGGGSNHIVRNNFVSGAINDQTTGTGAFGTTFGAYGIRVASGTGHKVYHNSVNLYGAIPGATNQNITAAFVITAVTLTGVDVRNNIFSNQITGGNLSGTRNVVLILPSGGTNTMNLTLNNNIYFPSSDPNSRLAQVGTTFGSGEFLAADFNPNSTSPATNLRAYTSTLSAAGTNDNASKLVDPLFVSSSDLHIQSASPAESMGVDVGVTDDIDGNTRPSIPDIGADEITLAGPGTLQFSQATYNGTEGTTATITVTRTGGLDGTVSVQAAVTGGTATGGAACTAGVDYINPGTQTLTFAMGVSSQSFNVQLCNDAVFDAETVIFGLSNVTGGATIGANSSATLNIIDLAPPFNGPINVGTGQNYPSLTNPGGAFEAINNSGTAGPVTINITSDLTAETGTVSLNQITGGFSVTIQPSGGAARTISGSNGTALINLNGADNVTFNGLNTGGNSLTIINTGAGAVIRLINDASNNTIQNTAIEGATTSATSAAVFLSTGTTTGNDNNTISGNIIRDRTAPAGVSANSFASIGTSAAIANGGNSVSNNQVINFTASGILIGATGNENWTINGNDISQTANRTTAILGINVASSLGTNTISQNTIHGLRSSFAAGNVINTAGIFMLDIRDATVSRNRLYDFPALAGGTGRIVGIEFEGASGTTSTATVVNNMVSIVTSVATAQSVFGIFDFAFTGNTFNGYYNSVYIGGTSSGASNSWAINRGFDPTNHTLRNNIAFNNRTGGTGNHFGGGDQAPVGVGTYSSDFNFFAGTGATTAANFMDRDTTGTGASTPVSFPTWQASPPARDANSVAGVASTFNQTDFFVDANGGNLHLKATATAVLDKGTPVAGVTTDFDGETRSATTPDLGADEFSVVGPGTIALSSATYSVSEAAASVTITVNRTSGTTGAVSVNYSLSDGTATGGAACGGNVDYINTGGMVNFADGQSSQTFNVTICPDALNKADETFNVTLSGATGGATLGTPSTAVVTITNDDPQPSITITDVTQSEGNAGTTNFTFNVNLSTASGQNVTVHYQTADGTATAPSDYTAIPDTTLTFTPGQTSLPVTVSVNGDTTFEPNETFFVNLSNATNATIADSQGVGTINNDDAQPTTLSINDVRVVEGNSGTTTATFTVTLTGTTSAVTVQYATADGTATAGSDYVATNGTLSFMPLAPEGGPVTITRTISVTIIGDTVKEPNETFFVNLSNPTGGAIISDGQGVGIIIDDDRAYVSDFDHDRKSDFTVFRPSDGVWYTYQSTNNVPVFTQFGVNGDIPVPGDYDGDGITDRAVWRPSDHVWYIFQSSDTTFQYRVWGLDGDKPVQGDYNGDGKTDVAVFRPSDGVWYVLQYPTGPVSGFQFGISTDKPVQGDYDGDGKTDFAVFRNGTYFIRRSSDNTVAIQSFGLAGDRPVSGDFDGDGKTDLAIFRNGVWWITESLTGNVRVQSWGLTNDIPVPADYDGDGTSDVAVFRPSDGIWYVLRSSNNTLFTINWGVAGDIPIPSAYLPQ